MSLDRGWPIQTYVRPGAVDQPSSARRSVKTDLYPFLLLTPALAVALMLSFGPLLYGIWLSLHDWYLLFSLVPTFQGLAGYVQLASDGAFWRAVLRTIFWTVGTVVFELTAGFGMALLLNRPTLVARTLSAVILLPWAIPFIVVAYGWQYLLDARSGPVHMALKLIGVVDTQSALADPTLALIVITLISGWKGTPFMAIALLAALKSIPTELYEAAEVDGAKTTQQFRHITLPLTRNAALITSMVLGILAFYSFDLAWIMTTGGPGEATTLVGIRVYQAFFVELRPSYAATMSSALLVALGACALLLLKLRRSE